MALTEKQLTAFFAKVRHDPATGCHLWTAYIGSWGYGRFAVGRRPQKAHRLAYEIAHGQIPAGLCVRHTCDTPACVNPEHLVLGTMADNVADRVERGRSYRKLSAEQVSDIRIASGNCRNIGKRFDVSAATVSLTRRGLRNSTVGAKP